MPNEIPKLTPEQLQAARQAATKARQERAAMKDAVRSGELSVSQALAKAAGNEILSRIRVLDLVKTQPRIGDKRALDVLHRLGIAENRRIRGLGKHQLDALIAEFH
ncbi:MAG: 30S ribosomal protein S13 [Propionibacteriaceae bacterium]|nr:30S ribosomal protein S13 [Propionibacteriaceae bacterium]